MIPKVIHYCWFGGKPLDAMGEKCLASWKRYCPDYEIIEWNEKNFDIRVWPYAQEAYEAKKWAFVSDVARLYALVNYGGIYMDTDVELLKPLDELLELKAFSGFEGGCRILTGLMASEKAHPLFAELLDEYQTAHFLKDDGSFDMTTNVVRITNACMPYGLQLNNTLQTVNGFTLFPKEYFCPKNHHDFKLNLTENSYCIHHFDGSWLRDEDKMAKALREKFVVFLPLKIAGFFSRFFAVVKYRGLTGIFSEIKQRIYKHG